jgi:hypothetical protein
VQLVLEGSQTNGRFMKGNMMKKLILTMILLSSAFARAGETQLIISIDKEGVRPDQIRIAVNTLNHRDLTTGICYAETLVRNYIDYRSFAPTAPYFGVAIVNFKWNCDDYGQAYLTKITASKAYTVWSNPKTGPLPAVSGSN